MTGRAGNVSAWGHRDFAVPAWTASLAGVIALVVLLGWSGDAPAQSAPPTGALVAAEPEPNALLATAPDRISLAFAEPVDLESVERPPPPRGR